MNRLLLKLSVLVTLPGLLSAASMYARAIPRVDEKKDAAPQTVHVGGDIKPPVKVKTVAPVYPPEAVQARVQGVVMLEVTIGTDGKVKDIKVLRSVKGLDDAATTAVRGWTYKPTLVNGQAVQVITTVPVVFMLD